MACAIRSPQELCQNFETVVDISAGYTAWTMYKLDDTVVINKATAAYGATAVLYYNIPKVVVDCLTVSLGNLTDYGAGSKVYFDATTNAVTPVAGSNSLCGIVTKVPSSGDTTVEIHLDGTLEIVA